MTTKKMKSQPSPNFSASALLQHQRQEGFNSHDFPTSREQLAEAQTLYAAKQQIVRALWNAIQDDTAELTIRTQTQHVHVFVGEKTLSDALRPIITYLEGELSRYEHRILQQRVYVEAGINECGLDASEQQWAVSELLAAPAESSPLHPSTEKQAA
ncbi:hypothetical protein [Hymenobacter profundi]|uniref:DUF721 domain-containing protein n=1 Tax=Hymenobacter profundi TaxID=1982110 RepID=A0ABS6WZB8_9BACT|nr:hypothetical protein [Hymenobacter profundi]MBW3128858.1 hypothetical protein [Hymenobacter profundi]